MFLSIFDRNQPTPFNRPVASVKPMMTTPVPMKPKDGVSIIPQTKPGVTVHKIVTTTDITLPGTTTNTQSGVSASGGTLVNKIPAGQQVFVIKTPKGVYIRTKEGKIFAVRAKTPLLSGISTESTSSVTTVTIKNSTATGIVCFYCHHVWPFCLSFKYLECTCFSFYSSCKIN